MIVYTQMGYLRTFGVPLHIIKHWCYTFPEAGQFIFCFTFVINFDYFFILLLQLPTFLFQEKFPWQYQLENEKTIGAQNIFLRKTTFLKKIWTFMERNVGRKTNPVLVKFYFVLTDTVSVQKEFRYMIISECMWFINLYYYWH